VADIIRDVVRTSAALAEKHADFMHEMEHLRELGGHRERVLSALSQLLVSVDLNDEAKLRWSRGFARWHYARCGLECIASSGNRSL